MYPEKKYYWAISLFLFLLIGARLFSGVLKPLIEYSPNSIFTAAYIAFALLSFVFFGFPKKFILFLLLILLIVLMSVAISDFHVYGVLQQANSGLRYLLLPLTIYIAKFSLNRYRLDYWFKCFAWFFIFASTVGILLGLSREIQGIDRVEFPFENPNTLGNFFALLAWSAVILSLNLKRPVVDIKIEGQYLLIILASSILVYSSGSFNALFLIALLHIYIFRWIGLGTLKLIMLIPAIVVGSFFIYNSQFLLDRFYQVVLIIDPTDFFYGGSSLAWRFRTWLDYLYFIDITSLFLGQGAGASRVWFESWAPGYLINSSGDIPGTHNDYLMLLFDFGVVGLLIFMFLIVKFVRYCVASKVDGVLIALFGLLVYMIFDNLLDSFILMPFVFFLSHLFNILSESQSAIDR